MAPTYSVHPNWPHLLGVLSILLALLAGWFRLVLLVDIGDPLRCNALLTGGTWLDTTHRNWQPDGCMMHAYTPQDGELCLRSRDVTFVGDSVTRKLFFQFAHILDPSLPTAPANDNSKHQDYMLQTASGSRVSFVWDPFLNGTAVNTMLAASPTAEANATHQSPAMLIMGSGLWYLRYADRSGGVPAWEANVEAIFTRLSTRRDRKVADAVVMLPVEHLVPSKLSPERFSTMHPSDIDAMNSDLFHRVRQHHGSNFGHPASPVPVLLPLAFNELLDPSLTQDGIHYSDILIQKQAQILLNLKCNDVLPKRFPFNKTCCNRYPWPNIAHGLLLGAVMILTPLLCYRLVQSSPDIRSIASVINTIDPSSLSILIMSGGLTLIYFSDRSWLWLKEHKQFDAWSFAFLSLSAFCVGLATLKRADKDLGFLNRDQTDEWKGWMQVAILIYHYLGASKVSGIYNPIRCLVAAYLFMTGYGHTTFYLRKADFGFRRVAQVLIRLNLLTILLAYVMDTDYLFYYFSPLVSMWYLIIYFTMATGSQLNGHTSALILKIFASAALTASFMWYPPLLEAIFSVLEVFGIQWSAREWGFRVGLDLWIVYAGMLTSIFVLKVRETRLTEQPQWPLVNRIAAGASICALIWYFVFELLQESKFTYNRWHPYIAFIPVLAFAILRNASVILRSVHSQGFAFIGKCSLETFIIQYHFWLAGDTKGVLLVLPGTRLRPLNFIITSIMFIYLSDRMAYATSHMTTWICSEDHQTESLPNPISTSNTRPRDGEPSAGELEMETRAAKGALLEPDTPIRPTRWLDRLAAHPAASRPPPAPWSSSALGGLKGRCVVGLFTLLALNVAWKFAR